MNNGHVYSELQPAFTHALPCDMPVAASILSNPIKKSESHTKSIQHTRFIQKIQTILTRFKRDFPPKQQL